MNRSPFIKQTWAILAAILPATVAIAGSPEPKSVLWDQLPDTSAQEFEDPFQALDTSQLAKLSEIARIRQLLETKALPEEEQQSLKERQSSKKADLANEGIDADWLISQRWLVAERRTAAANAGNAELANMTVRISGFAIPAPPDEQGNEMAYLVPLPGMCSHMPPPNPNQLIQLKLSGGWSPSRMHEHVRVTGTLHLSPSARDLWLVDGQVEMNASWQLDVEKAEPSFSAPVPLQQDSAWAASLQSRLSKTQAAHETDK
ncbi:DUF3299 domain-containing protein [Seohaeicola saemankumensis]|nr:DUF3299 domain-containing protein [Seohaeicola saemankumensis]MCA0873759.1 DUF3299 domain-containing protein [Seohaeicola saemankumensis]